MSKDTIQVPFTPRNFQLVEIFIFPIRLLVRLSMPTGQEPSLAGQDFTHQGADIIIDDGISASLNGQGSAIPLTDPIHEN